MPWPAAACVLVLRDGGVLAVFRKDGKLGLPAGKINPGEPVDEAAARELLEETGLEVKASCLVMILDTIEASTGDRVVTFFAEDTGQEVKPGHDERPALWVGWQALTGPTGAFPDYNLSVKNAWADRIPSAWIDTFGSGSLRRAVDEGMRWQNMYRSERAAFEFGYGFEVWQDSRVTTGSALAEGDSPTTTETCWWARVLRHRAAKAGDEHVYVVVHATVSDDDGVREGVAIECVPSPRPRWMGKEMRLIAFTKDNPC